MRKTRILAIIMAILMCLTVVGCNKDGDKKNPHGKLENPNIRIVYWQSQEAYDTAKAENPDVFDVILDTIPEFEKEYGGKVELIAVDWGQMLEKTVSMQSADDAPDLVMISDQTFHNVVTGGVVMELDELTTDDDYSFWKVGRDLFTWKGKTYGIPIKPYFKHILYNKTKFQEHGLKTPREYFDEGNWTFDTFAEVGKKLTYDSDKDGEIDQWGFSTWDDFIPAITLCNGGAFLKVTTDGITSGLKDPATLEAMQYISDWIKQPGGFINLEMSMFEEFDNGNLAMIVGKEYPQDQLPFEVDMVPYPVGPSSKDKAVFVYPQGWGIPTGSKNPEGAAAFVYLANKITKEKGDELEKKRFGDERFEMINGDDLNITYSLDKGLSSIWEIIGTITNKLYDQVPPATIAEELEPVINADIEKTYGK